MDKVMTYYWKKSLIGSEDKIVARSYKATKGFIFDMGTAFDDRHPVSELRRFFVTRHTICETMKNLTYMQKELQKEYPNAEIYTTEEKYR